MTHRTTTLTLALAVLASGAALAALVPGTSAAPLPALGFGMDAPSIGAQTSAGVKPDYATFWIGPWTLKSGWGGPDALLDSMRNAGVTPAIHFYYWGDDISQSCIENGCWSSLHGAQKDKAGWQRLAEELVAHLNAKMAGRPVLIFLETEFNKGNVGTYEPLDGYLAEKAQFIRAGYPSAQIVMALGNWAPQYWSTWDRTAAASDLTGIQGMRGSTKQNLADYGTLYEGLQAGATKLRDLFGKPIILQDIALSSYPEPDWLKPQADTLREVFDHLGDLKATGVRAIIYRSWLDSPGMDLANYYGMAERYWGFANTGAWKPSASVWVEGVKAERASPAQPGTPPAAVAVAPGTVAEAETFAIRQAGGAQSDPAASGGRMWNLWSNGAIAQTFELRGSHELVVRVRGTVAAGVGPHMDVYVGGTKVLAADPGTSYTEFRAPVSGSGPLEVRIQFTNDLVANGQDRNLIVDTVHLAAPNAAPVAVFTASTDGLSVSVDAAASSDADGDRLTFRWEFGDGATATGASASHTYAAGGTYTVRLAASDGRAESTATRTVTAKEPNRAPSASFQAATEGLSAAFDATATSDADGDALTYAWSFGDGATGSGATARHTYTQAGTYTVRLEASDGQLSSSATRAVTVTQPNRAPTAAVQVQAQGLTVTVDASASSDPDGDALSYAWSLGDGASATGRSASHTYARPGTYVVTLAVSDGRETSTASRTVTVEAPTFSASFTVASGSNEWWQEVRVQGSSPPARVAMSVDGGAWRELTLRSWGGWATSTHVAKGTPVQFRATDAHGQTAHSAVAPWLGAAAPPPSTFSATLAPKAVGNDWWIEAKVTSSSKAVAKVEVSRNGGAWTELGKTSWGSFAKSLHAPNGTKVAFRAVATTGEVATGSVVTWT